MRQRRPVDYCSDCGELKEIYDVKRQLCNSCWRARRREELRKERGPVDRYAGAVSREAKKLIRGFSKMLDGAGDLGFSKEDMLDLKALCEPYLQPVAAFLGINVLPVVDDNKKDGQELDEEDTQEEKAVRSRKMLKQPVAICPTEREITMEGE